MTRSGTKHQYVRILSEAPPARISDAASILPQTLKVASCISVCQNTADISCILAKCLRCFGMILTLLAAKFFGASAGLAHRSVSVFHRRVLGRAIEARADRVAALGLRAHALPTLFVGGDGD